jgi:hypothetical protein
MTDPALVVRLSRRAVAAVLLSTDRLTLFDGLHLRSSRDAAVAGVRRYLQKLVDVIHPRTVIVDAPSKPGGQTEALLVAIRESLLARGVNVNVLAAATVLAAFGLPALGTRRELRSVAEPLFEELVNFRGKIKPYVVDAAAGALLMESASALGGQSP